MTISTQSSETEPIAKMRLRLWLKLLKSTNHVEGQVREKLRATFDTTLPRFDVMSALSRYEKGLKMSELSSVLKVSNGNVTGIIDRLVEDGFVVRSPVPGDRRAWLVRLTKRGLEEFEKQASAHEIWVDQLLSNLPTETIENMLGDLDTITANSSNGETS